MRRIADALSDPDCSGILISGAAGVGKSRVARTALEVAKANGSDVRWVVGTSSARALPLGALAQWAGSGSLDSLDVVRGVIDSLSSGAPNSPVVIGVDDVHLLDDLSTFVVHQVIQRHTAKVILTVREREPISDATQELWREGGIYRLDLQPLSHDETSSLVSTALGGRLDPDAAERIWRLTRGNVLYLQNIVEQEVSAQRLISQKGVWRWVADPVVPPGLVQLIETRMGALAPEVSDVIDTLAVGEPLELSLLSGLTDSAAIEEADVRGLIALDKVGERIEARVAHPLYGEVRRKRVAATRLRRLRGLVAARLADSEDYDDIRVVVRRATLSVDSDLPLDPELLLQAAHGAVWLGDLPLADLLGDAAIRAGAGPEANFLRAHVLSLLNRGEEALAVLGACSLTELSPDDQARLAFLRSHVTLFTCGDPVAAKDMIDDAARHTPPGSRHYIDAFLALYSAALGYPRNAIEYSKGCTFDGLPAVIGAGTAMAMSVAYGDAGCTTEAIAAAESGYAITARSFDAAWMRFIVADGHIGALLQAGRVAEACGVAESLHQQASDLPGAAQLFSLAQVGMTALAAGRLDEAHSRLASIGESWLASGDTTGWGYRYLLPRTIVAAMRGLVDEAVTALGALDERRHPTWRYLDWEYALARAWVVAAAGAVSDAVTTLRTAAETARADGQLAAEVMCLQTATQFGDRSCAARLGELESIVDGPRAGLAARFAEAIADNEADELAAISADFEEMGDRIAAIDAAAHAALAYRKKQLRGSTLRCSARAEALAAECGDASTPALRRVIEPLPLTDREREIVMLLGEDLSSREIAVRLTLSVRTIESHIYRSMAKTGVTTREELAALLPQRRRRPNN